MLTTPRTAFVGCPLLVDKGGIAWNARYKYQEPSTRTSGVTLTPVRRLGTPVHRTSVGPVPRAARRAAARADLAARNRSLRPKPRRQPRHAAHAARVPSSVALLELRRDAAVRLTKRQALFDDELVG